MLKPFCAVALLVILTSCATGAPPSAFERTAYLVTTNLHTNVVPVATIDTNRMVTGTNWITNIFQTYDLQPRPSAEAGIQAVGVAATWFGFGLGGIIASLVLGLYGAYATWKNARNAKAATVLTQNVQTLREVIKVQPGGEALDVRAKEQIKAQQVDAGVKALIADIVDNSVNEVKAKSAAAMVNKSDVLNGH